MGPSVPCLYNLEHTLLQGCNNLTFLRINRVDSHAPKQQKHHPIRAVAIPGDAYGHSISRCHEALET